MGLIACPDCEKDFSEAAPACPHCGRPRPEALAGPKSCPFCGSSETLRYEKTSQQGCALIVVGLILAPVLIGIILIIMGIGMKEVGHHCTSCGRKF